MSREFGDTLSKEDVRKIADVRRDIWTSGFKGLAYGSVGGYTLHTITRLLHNSLSEAAKGKLVFPGSSKPIRFNRNTAFFSFMAGGAFTSFVLATTTGKNKVHNMHDVFEVGKHEYKSPYQTAYDNARIAAEEDSEESGEKRRVSRRQTVSKRLVEGHGLSDSHGGTWFKEDNINNEDEKRRAGRRSDMARRLTNPNVHGLSDSHGGKWRD